MVKNAVHIIDKAFIQPSRGYQQYAGPLSLLVEKEQQSAKTAAIAAVVDLNMILQTEQQVKRF